MFCSVPLLPNTSKPAKQFVVRVYAFWSDKGKLLCMCMSLQIRGCKRYGLFERNVIAALTVSENGVNVQVVV